MNEIVVTALKKPYTFVVLSILIVVFGIRGIFKTPTDVFPSINIPVVAVVWTYTGLMPEDMSGRVVYYYERALTATVNNIEHIESQSYYGRGIVKIFFQPGTDTAVAQTQITSVSQTVIKQMPTGSTPPLILTYNASSVPVITLQVASTSMTASEIYNMASNYIRPALVSVAGAAIPNPYGGQPANIMVDLDPIKLLAHKLSPVDVSKALGSQNIVLPAGDQRIGPFDWMVQTNASPRELDELNMIPIKQVGNAVVRLQDVAWVHSGGPPQTNLVLVKGQQGVLIVIMKSGDASTLEVVAGVKALLPGIVKTLPPGVSIKILNDASTFVKESVQDVLREMFTAACLTGLVVLLFLGSWRSTVIIATSIPLAMLCSIICLGWAGQTINVMTLGGLALAVGILVDDATVMIENIDAHLEMNKDLETAIIDAANQIVIPTFVSTLCICIVWTPLFQLTGVAGWLFMPMAEAIVFAMIASFILSRTLVPTMAKFMLAAQVEAHRAHAGEAPKTFFGRFQKGFERRFEAFRHAYYRLLKYLVSVRTSFIPIFVLCSVLSMGLLLAVGQDFFPEVNSDALAIHMRAPLGTRLMEAGKISELINQEIERTLPGQVEGIVDNCGLPFSALNQAFIPTPTVGTQDCDLTVSLKNSEAPVAEYRRLIRRNLMEKFPGTQISFMPGDLTSKILNFGLPSPIDVQIVGRNLTDNFKFANRLAERLRHVTGLTDISVQQPMTTPTLRINARRTYALGTGITESDVANNALVSLSGSSQVGQVYWLDVTTGVSHLIDIQTPAAFLQTMNDLELTPVDKGDGNPSGKNMQILGGLSHIEQTGTPGEVAHYNIMPVFDIYASNEGVDLGKASRDVEQIVDQERINLPHGSSLVVRGQAVTMNSAYVQLIAGLAMSILLVYLLIVVNFQSWLDPFIIIMALPGALAGISWSLFLTHTTLSVPALTGAIMCMGTATANAILVVAFARERLDEHGDAVKAALEAGYERIRPVLMTALAMIIGMLPMSMSNSQNAPLGKAVMGGLIVATVATLLFVPCVFALLHNHKKTELKSEGES
ncbi:MULTISPECIES: efflux RND transporter permease subunit [Acetobacter]|uniref:Efflux RND transporter permease subunit n=1 Tax=Acetobacter thailandicus TaxID=1502842 RepID=A0ABT3QF56_9PROT|nr:MULTISPECIES: efflux RND transporter permease subunit [Acetobacter]MBS0960045.1 efflux RND transporter permease subunit [Acetobacter thailandicus]MBS0979374.1 efflux RND transporter permease subunit [Acetobacter thailandicus]MBS0985578.1 efflux RND transporter permease subunit [Acetobacter thailandicus]MBS1002493.1 efflux RND transporter permease subunit [Acetobacter thailandicus]MCX2563908.1 efflux RND transporter permease subunit [Acetobacter thailandicus]